MATSFPTTAPSPVPARRMGQLVILLCTLAIAAFLAWSIWARLDQISRARGQVIPSGRTQIVQSVDGGVIEKILVREGDHVDKGQLLVTLDRVKLAAAVAEGRAKVAALKATMARIDAELFDKPLTFPPELKAYPAFMANQRLLYAKRRAALGSTVGTLGQMLSLSQQELAMYRPLVDTGDVSRSEVLRMQRGVSDVQGQIANHQNRYLTELQAEFTKTQEDLVTAEESLTQRLDAYAATELRSPVTGIVKNVRLTTLGGVLKPGDEVLEIVPTGEELIVEAKVSPSDIAFIRSGQSASVKFDAFDSSIYGAAEGKVTFISPDTLIERRPDEPADTYYRVHLTVDTRSMHPVDRGERIEIQPGMTATAEIKTGRNTVFQYLTKPITKTLSQSMGER
ncbi:HlyD family type I secretion periplasmic adaptor subunit [Sphingobium sp. CFD-2]|uniref:HlyD family type I secretion periplasmic adaptor subunit n=1 Tax=Sphingobium sp. CFD-2 TaxID=2878542 RepID=UPI00214C36AA|nr:HlyD family type I secretion periplasmic adaptor subunit [Sphingobium sp. CFD-2]